MSSGEFGGAITQVLGDTSLLTKGVARRIQHYLTYAPAGEITRLFQLAVDSARADRKSAERAEVAAQVRVAIPSSGITAAQVAQLIGKSTSRLSTYAKGSVCPSAHMPARIKRAATRP